MAVIITDMVLPKDCMCCRFRTNLNICRVTNKWCKAKPCPLKSADEMIAEIDIVYIGYRHAYEVAHDYKSIIHKYCDKEDNNGNIKVDD